MKWTKSRKLQHICDSLYLLTLLSLVTRFKRCMRSNEKNPFDNQLSISLCHDVNVTIWHVRDTLWRADVSVCYQLLLFCDSDEGLWQLDRESLWWSDDGVRTWLPVTRLVIRDLTWLLSSYLGDYFTARHYCCYYRQEIWVKIVTKPPPLGPASGYFAPNYPAVTEISCSLTKCDN